MKIKELKYELKYENTEKFKYFYEYDLSIRNWVPLFICRIILRFRANKYKEKMN